MAKFVYALALLGCSLGMAALGALVWRWHRRESVARRYVLFVALAAIWLLLHASETVSDQVGPRFLIAQLRWALAAFFHVVYLAMVLDFCGHHRWLRPRRFAPLPAIAAIIAVLSLTSRWHPWFVTDFRLVDAGFRSVPQFTRQAGFWIFQIHMNVLMVVALAVLVGAMRQGTALFRHQAFLLSLAWMVPNLTNIFNQHYREFVFGGVNLTPFSSVIFLLLTAWALFRHRLFDLAPVARAAVMESVPDAVLVFDALGRLSDLNPAAQRLLGLANHWLGQPAGRVLSAWPEALEGLGNADEQQISLATKDALPRNLDGRLSPLHGRNGEFCGQVLILRDVTAQKAAEERYRQLLECNPLGMTVVDTATGMIVYANQKAIDLLEASREQVIGSAAVSYYANPADRERTTSLFAQQGHLADYEVLLKSASGRTAWCLMTTTPTIYDGRPCNVSSILDVTERKQAEAILRAKAQTEAVERQQRAILEHLPVGVIVTTGPKHKILYQNPRFEAMFGYTIEEIPDAAHWWPLAYPDPGYRQSLQEEWGRWMARFVDGEKELEPMEVTITTRDGATKQVGVHISAMDELYFLTFIDLTERKQAEEARRERDAAEAANKAKSRFLANMSHEIRTPLNAILGFAQVLERDAGLDTAQRDKLATIRRSGEHLLELINDILDMAKIETGRLTLRLQAFDLSQLVSEAGGLFRQRAHERRLALSVEADELPQFVTGDETKLRQVLINLLSNAVKFTSEGSVRLRVEAQTTGGVRFSVADTGMGIAAAEMGRLFEPFSQTASGLKVQEGTGLGLAISRQFVRLMGGELEVASTPGQGSCFSFALPLAVVETAKLEASSQTELPVAGLEPGQPSCRILIADDQANNRVPLRDLLDSLNPSPPVLEFREAADGREAVTIWNEWQPHLVFMDMRMPVLPGEEAARQIKVQMAARPGTVRTVIVALAAGSFDDERGHFLACGCDELARKPFRAQELFAILQRCGLRLIRGPKPPEPVAALPSSELARRLARCPADWLAALRAALDCGNSSKISALVEQIRNRDAALHAALAKWAYDCDHEAIIALFEGVPPDRGSPAEL